MGKPGSSFFLPDVAIGCSNDYASIVLVSMDGKPLARSRRVLLRFGAAVRPTGWEVKPATREVKGESLEGYEIVKTGRLPWRMMNARAEIGVKNPHPRTAHILNSSGVTTKEVPLEVEEDRVRHLVLPEDALYILLKGE